MLEKDISTFMQHRPNGMLLVHVDEHRSMCPDPHFRRGAMRVLAELPGHGNLHRHSTLPAEVFRNLPTTHRMLPDAGMKERLPMDDIDMENQAILLRVRRFAGTRFAEIPP